MGRVTFDSNDGQNRSVAIPIRAADIGAELALQPTSVNFGRVPAGELVSEYLIATNVGQAALEVSELEVNGSSDFGVRSLAWIPASIRQHWMIPTATAIAALRPVAPSRLRLPIAPM